MPTTNTRQLITPAQAEQFLVTGFIRLDNIIEEDEINALQALYNRCFSKDTSAEMALNAKNLGGYDSQGRKVLPQILNPHQQFPESRQTDYHKNIAIIARAIFGTQVT